ncbi:MAG: DNA polymerase I [Candidatus Buchananbacteria bacterium RIFCSPHIGHO2_01_FULL_44_11]|uniref:DNA polymerase I n=1 Tax=Candidatus Buchananbacteria bacterium RIFCSPHIGHO2_01_FULL_44_11 TaxID=1797535 RepID=A0A1G1Y0U7_9BACT|nr:MAG: DNA polymerase I [Candidatus Buchananbacteria bacterium RIFCSPHIGHO2_01_FULL_44_11]
MSKKTKLKFIIIDGNALLHRAWHALPPTLTTKSGELVNAVYGFTMILLKVLKDLQPDYLAVTFDLKAPTFRHQEYAAYKANRIKQPDELYNQLPRIKEIVRAFAFPIYEKEGYEADDVIATLVRDKEVEKIQSIIVTGDLDTLQLIDNNTRVYTMHKGMSDTMIYDVAEVKQRFDGLTPAQMVDYKALRGDPSDNVPGVKGIGEKGAIQLLKDFKTLENIYKNIDSEKILPRTKKLLQEQKKEALMSKKLCQMITDVPIDFKLKAAKLDDYDLNKILPLFQELEFKSLISKLPKPIEPIKSTSNQGCFEFGQTTNQPLSQPRSKASGQADYQLVNDQKTFKDFLTRLQKQKEFAVDTETSGLDPFNTELLGVSFCWQAGLAFYLNAKPEYLEKIKPILADQNIKKVGHNIKFDLESLKNAGLKVAGVDFDTMIASYLINPGSRQHNLDGLAFTELGYQMQPITDLIGQGKNQISLKQVPIERVADYSCEDADFTWRLVAILKKQLKEKNNLGLLEKIEMPLVPVLAAVEENGIMIDTDFLNQMAKEVKDRLNKIEAKIYKLTSQKFNIASPLQLKEILFDKLKIATQGLAKTKTGISTAASELEKLKGLHPVIDSVIEFRELAKLSSTYLEALPKLVSPKDGRLHTSFNQTVAATGRLSSSEPNLQNIPVRTELGQKIRRAFIAPAGFKILSADYSQIELRIIASLANDTKMIASFKNGEDIHTRTAADIHEIPLDQVTKPMRYEAKAVNFGVIYGQGPHGLAQGAGIPFAQARDFIDRYFLLHSNIAKFLEQTKELARQKGYVETWFGRRRYLPEINSNLQQIRATAERMAINHPVQGTAADLMKLAMIEIQTALPKISSRAKMILQVHDELVFEVPAAEIKKVAALVKAKMEGVYKLRTPVETHVSVGNNWGQLKPLE